MTKVAYFCCSSCGYEASDVFVEYWGKTANGEWYICPRCGEESNNTIGRQYVAAEAASWQVGEYIRDRIREKWKATADLVIAEVLTNGPDLRAKIAEEIEKKLRAQLTAAMRQVGR